MNRREAGELPVISCLQRLQRPKAHKQVLKSGPPQAQLPHPQEAEGEALDSVCSFQTEGYSQFQPRDASILLLSGKSAALSETQGYAGQSE